MAPMIWSPINPERVLGGKAISSGSLAANPAAPAYSAVSVDIYRASATTLDEIGFSSVTTKIEGTAICFVLDVMFLMSDFQTQTIEDSSGKRLAITRSGCGMRAGIASWNIKSEVKNTGNISSVAAGVQLGYAQSAVAFSMYGLVTKEAKDVFVPLISCTKFDSDTLQMLGQVTQNFITLMANPDKAKDTDPKPLRYAVLPTPPSDYSYRMLYSYHWALENIYNKRSVEKAMKFGSAADRQGVDGDIVKMTYDYYKIPPNSVKDSAIHDEVSQVLTTGRF